MRVVVAVLVAMAGAVAGAVVGGALTYALLSGEEGADALTWLALALFLFVPAMLGGAVGAGLLFGRIFPGVIRHGTGASLGYGVAAVALLLVAGPPVAIDIVARNDDVPQAFLAGLLCSKPGIRYIDDTTRGLRVCLTLTEDRSAWLEFGWRFGQGSDCAGEATYLDWGNLLATPGRIAEPEFTARIRGARASGVLRDPESFCGDKPLAWSARQAP